MPTYHEQIEKCNQMILDARHLVVFTGAGISADSGIPTFRGSGAESFWGKYSAEQLATPEGFHANPKLVYDWYNWRRKQLAQTQPNAAHLVIAQWQKKLNATVITQNIDGLHEQVAPPQATVLCLHGTLAEDRCSYCSYHEAVNIQSPPELRNCPRCTALLRPAVVWFNEPLDPDVWNRCEEAVQQCDVLVVIGTSGQVWPAVDLVHQAANHARIIIINLEPGELDELAAVAFHGRAADILPQLG